MQTGVTGGVKLAAVTSLAGMMCVIAMLFGGVPKANAEVYGFCENVLLGQNGYCGGPATGMYQDYGWGDQHSVCVDIRPWPGVRRCSSGAGAGVYSGEISKGTGGTPWIENNAPGENYVHGIYLT
jgi:hypothetical protein